MNYMPEVLKMLGLEVGEKFNVERFVSSPFHFNENYDLVDKDDYFINELIKLLLSKEVELEKLPYKPKNGDVYFIVKHEGTGIDRDGCVWVGDYIDYYCYNAGNCFKTAEEITDEIKQRILSEMKGKYEND